MTERLVLRLLQPEDVPAFAADWFKGERATLRIYASLRSEWKAQRLNAKAPR